MEGRRRSSRSSGSRAGERAEAEAEEAWRRRLPHLGQDGAPRPEEVPRPELSSPGRGWWTRRLASSRRDCFPLRRRRTRPPSRHTGCTGAAPQYTELSSGSTQRRRSSSAASSRSSTTREGWRGRSRGKVTCEGAQEVGEEMEGSQHSAGGQVTCKRHAAHAADGPASQPPTLLPDLHPVRCLHSMSEASIHSLSRASSLRRSPLDQQPFSRISARKPRRNGPLPPPPLSFSSLSPTCAGVRTAPALARENLPSIERGAARGWRRVASPGGRRTTRRDGVEKGLQMGEFQREINPTAVGRRVVRIQKLDPPTEARSAAKRYRRQPPSTPRNHLFKVPSGPSTPSAP